MINDALLDGILDWPTINDVDRLVAEVRRQRAEIDHLRGALERVRTGISKGPLWIEDEATEALKRDFRLL